MPQLTDSGYPGRERRERRRRGGSVLEMARLMRWYVLLSVGAFDWGYYAHALISTAVLFLGVVPRLRNRRAQFRGSYGKGLSVNR
jgi:hypothetical protein